MSHFFAGLASLIVAVIFILLCCTLYFYSLAIKRNKKDFLRHSKDLAQTMETYKNKNSFQEASEQGEQLPPFGGKEWIESMPCETWNIVSKDGLKLAGCFIPAKKSTGKTVIIAHGYSSKGRDNGSFARFYHEKLGFNVLMPDARGHGASEGNYIGFGWPERLDYLLWIQKVIEQVGAHSRIVLHGISMGGATVMMTSGEDLPKQVKAIIEDCGYTSVYDELSWQMRRLYHLPPFPLLPITSLFTKLRAGYDFYEASSVEQVKKSKTPILFIHGDSDTFVPAWMVWELYNACNSEKDIYIVKGAGHGVAYDTDRASYEKKVAEFIGRYID